MGTYCFGIDVGGTTVKYCYHLYYQAKYDAFVIQIQRLLSVLAMADKGGY